MTLEQYLTWGAIAGLYAWQFMHGRSCMEWRSKVSREQGEIAGMLREIMNRMGKK